MYVDNGSGMMESLSEEALPEAIFSLGLSEREKRT